MEPFLLSITSLEVEMERAQQLKAKLEEMIRTKDPDEESNTRPRPSSGSIGSVVSVESPRGPQTERMRTLDNCMRCVLSLNAELAKRRSDLLSKPSLTNTEDETITQLLHDRTSMTKEQVQERWSQVKDLHHPEPMAAPGTPTATGTPQLLRKQQKEQENKKGTDRQAERAAFRTEIKNVNTHLQTVLESANAVQLRKILRIFALESEDVSNRIISMLEKKDKTDPASKTSSVEDLRKEISKEERKEEKKASATMEAVHMRSRQPGPSQSAISSTLMYDSYVMVKINNKWKRRFVVITPEILHIFKAHDDNRSPENINLTCASVRMVSAKKQQFTLYTPSAEWRFEAESDRELLQMTAVLEDICQDIVLKSIGTEKNMQRSDSNGNNEASSDEENEDKKELLDLLHVPGNNICADCGTPKPEWVSINLGIFICIECSGAHRNLGVHISKVRSVQYDQIESENMLVLKATGNIKANSLWEGALPPGTKPGEHAHIDVKNAYIRNKYAEMVYARPEDVTILEAYLEKPSSPGKNRNSGILYNISPMTPRMDKSASGSPALGLPTDRQHLFMKSNFRKSTGNLDKETKEAKKERKEKEKEGQKEKEKQKKKEKKEREEEEKKQQYLKQDFGKVLTEMKEERKTDIMDIITSTRPMNGPSYRATSRGAVGRDVVTHAFISDETRNSNNYGQKGPGLGLKYVSVPGVILILRCELLRRGFSTTYTSNFSALRRVLLEVLPGKGLSKVILISHHNIHTSGDMLSHFMNPRYTFPAPAYVQSHYSPTPHMHLGPPAGYYGKAMKGRSKSSLRDAEDADSKTKKHSRLSQYQCSQLEETFQQQSLPSKKACLELAEHLDMPYRRVQVWFQNRRAKVKRMKSLSGTSEEAHSSSEETPHDDGITEEDPEKEEGKSETELQGETKEKKPMYLGTSATKLKVSFLVNE
ncbi:arf-GAP with SH3 domain, ANK repeat and PH domain-containing protein 1 [Planoprotostelium fungivorum]|uniref:Arf-GAP with SH3 domain, ANK repeat and PH domain-containing protein 1 n=1 Tax=Planoprotostelium fungivorum TaxID=1890364 RepID=A0A2P6NXG8_9EUKA|nr:arf-GAP with SH3 domain, ANK repeat and PH domain-containing protein 1 [Planoprotostelium fungivorum]